VPIIQKYCYGLTEQSGRQDEINGAISVDISRRDLKAANTGDNLKGLAPGGRELKLNPIVSAGGAGSPGLNADKVWTEVAVEIRDCKRQPGSDGSDWRLLDTRVCRGASANKAEQQQ
jgi:hypothetical protein